jgi:hypothetical protein
MYNREYTSERIIRLEPNEIFVFGSNLAGAARAALNRFGAVWDKVWDARAELCHTDHAGRSGNHQTIRG